MENLYNIPRQYSVPFDIHRWIDHSMRLFLRPFPSGNLQESLECRRRAKERRGIHETRRLHGLPCLALNDTANPDFSRSAPTFKPLFGIHMRFSDAVSEGATANGTKLLASSLGNRDTYRMHLPAPLHIMQIPRARLH